MNLNAAWLLPASAPKNMGNVLFVQKKFLIQKFLIEWLDHFPLHKQIQFTQVRDHTRLRIHRPRHSHFHNVVVSMSVRIAAFAINALVLFLAGFLVQGVGMATSFLEDQANGTYYDGHFDYRMSYSPLVSQTRRRAPRAAVTSLQT